MSRYFENPVDRYLKGKAAEEKKMSGPELCRFCSDGDEPQLVDEDGVSVDISGNPGKLRHCYEDFWWACESIKA